MSQARLGDPTDRGALDKLSEELNKAEQNMNRIKKQLEENMYEQDEEFREVLDVMRPFAEKLRATNEKGVSLRVRPETLHAVLLTAFRIAIEGRVHSWVLGEFAKGVRSNEIEAQRTFEEQFEEHQRELEETLAQLKT